MTNKSTLRISGITPAAARNWLTQLETLSFATNPTDAPSDSPRLALRLADENDPRLDPQGFTLTWNPGGNMAEMFDPSFRWHGDAGSSDISTPLADPPCHGTIVGADETGLTYGIREFLERCDVRGTLPPRTLDLRRSPSLRLRSACLQLMKKGQYILPVTQKEFSWFFDRAWCTRYLDFLFENRFNALTLWNFHPFPYFCRIDNHPEVTEVDEPTLHENAAHLRWLLDAAKTRGIRILWHFYNIYVCPSYARAHGLNTLHNQFTPAQEKQVFSYIRNSVRSFANAFPDVGFVACAGEGVPAGKAERFVADVLVAGLNETAHHPPLVVRQWSTLSASRFERDVVGRYDNLWAMLKHNAEQIAGTAPDARIRDWVATGVPVIVNMHMLSEIGPFRWSPPAYIREICLHYKALGVQGVHIYPHWPWRTPAVGDRNFNGDELQRDWLYHSIWGRYSFDPVRDPDEERRHWIRQAQHRGLPAQVATAMIDAYEAGGAALPRLQQHLWVHYDNHSVLPAGLTLGQLRIARSVHGRMVIRTDILEDLLPLRAELQGQTIQPGDYRFDDAAEQSTHELSHAIARMESVDFPAHDEPARLHADLKSMKWTVEYLRQKARIAGLLMRYSRDPSEHGLLHQAVAGLRTSVTLFRDYRDHAERGYEGISDVPPYFPLNNYQTTLLPYTWSDCLEVFERELKNVEAFALATQNNQPWSLVHYYCLDQVDPRHELESQFTRNGDFWLTGDPDFIPWSRHLTGMKKLVLLPNAYWPCQEISILSDLKLVKSWVKEGGHLILLTLPDLPCVEIRMLAQILELDDTALNPQTIESQNGRVQTIPADPRWTWNDRSDNHGIHGWVPLGKGWIEFIALSSPSQKIPTRNT